MGKQVGFVTLGEMISQGTGLQLTFDFILKIVKRPLIYKDSWVYLSFPSWGDQESIKAKKLSLVLDFMEKKGIEVKQKGRNYLVKIPDINTKVQPEEETKKVYFEKEDPKEFLEKYDELKKLHEELPIYGVANKDQPDLYKGVVNFNYFDEEETNKALKIFSEAGFGVEKREGKRCNLTFLLITEGVDYSKFEFGKGKPNGRTAQIFEWVIKKIHRKTLKGFSEKLNLGISERTTINVGVPEVFELKKSLEERFGMIILFYGTFRNKSEFCLLISEKAKSLYYESERKIEVCDLIQILRDPEKESSIINKYKLKTKKMEKLCLSKELINLFKENGLKTTPNKRKSLFIQVVDHNKDKYTSKVSIVYGGDKAESTVNDVSEIILNKHPNAQIKNGKGLGFYVSIPGYENIPKTKSDLPKTKNPPIAEEISDKKNLEKRLRELVEKGNLNDKVLREVREYLSVLDADNQEAISILRKLRN